MKKRGEKTGLALEKKSEIVNPPWEKLEVDRYPLLNFYFPFFAFPPHSKVIHSHCPN